MHDLPISLSEVETLHAVVSINGDRESLKVTQFHVLQVALATLCPGGLP